jgi:hypothetical protein
MSNTNLYTSELAEENKKKTRFDPLRPGYIRPDEDEPLDEFEEDIGISRTGNKRKKVRADVSCPCLIMYITNKE